MDPIYHLKRPQLYENECRWYIGTLVCCVFRNLSMYQCTICIYMYKHTNGTLVCYEKRTLNIYRFLDDFVTVHIGEKSTDSFDVTGS